MARQRRYCPSGTRDPSLALSPGYTDVIGTVDQAAAAAALTYEAYRDTPFLMYWMRNDQNDALSLKYQMPHGWDLSAVEPHMHILCGASVTGNVVLDGYYTWSHISGSPILGPLNTWTTFRTITTIQGSWQWTERGISLGLITPPAAAKVNSANLMIYLRRPGAADPDDTYDGAKPTPPGTAAANLGIVYLDCHVRLNHLGSVNLYTG